ncbi:MAG: NAD-dependent epimerase/dehydratase family protein [Thiogranum sp.]
MAEESDFKGKNILVTGASGFIGAHLCRRLNGLGAVVHGVSRHARNDNLVARWWQVDLEDEQETRRLVESVAPDTIFHLASFVSGKRELEFVLPALRSNFISTVNLLISATVSGCRKLVLTGSLEEAEGDAASATPVSPYAAAKGAAGAYARMFHALYGTPVVTARLFMVYGPDQPDHTKLVPYVTLSLLRGEVPQLMSGTREVDWIYVYDVIDAYLSLAGREGIDGETIDVGSGELASVRAVVDSIADVIRPAVRPSFGSVADRSFERVRVADVERACSLSGWKPKTALADGLKQTVEWYRNNVVDD